MTIICKSKYKKLVYWPIWIVLSNVSSIGPLSERKKIYPRRRVNARNIRLHYPYLQNTNLVIFRFVSLLCLRSRLYIMFINQIIEDPNHRLHTLLPELNTNTTHSVRTMRKSRNAGLIDTRAPLLSLVLVAPNFNILLFIFCT